MTLKCARKLLFNFLENWFGFFCSFLIIYSLTKKQSSCSGVTSRVDVGSDGRCRSLERDPTQIPLSTIIR